MNLTDLKQKPISKLQEIADEMGLEGVARSRKQDMIFSILKAHAKGGESIFGNGVLEILQDGFGFLRSEDSSYLAGPDDIYVSPSQIRRFALRTGTCWPAKSGRPRTVSAILHCSRSKKSTTNLRMPQSARSCLKT